MVDQLETVQKANGAMVRVIDLLAVEPDIVDEGTTIPPIGPLSIEFRDVSFDYGDDQSVLQSIDLELRGGPFGRHRRSYRQRQDDAVASGAAPRRSNQRLGAAGRRSHRADPDRASCADGSP